MPGRGQSEQLKEMAAMMRGRAAAAVKNAAAAQLRFKQTYDEEGATEGLAGRERKRERERERERRD